MPKGKKFGGRKAGTPNKVTASTRDALKRFIDSQQSEVERAFKKLQPKDKVFAYARLLPFVTPQYSAINFSLKNMSEEDLQFIIEHLKNNLDEQEDGTD